MMQEDNGKIRVLVFELEGSNETLQESLRTVMANALGQSLSPIRAVSPSPFPSESTLPSIDTEAHQVNSKKQTIPSSRSKKTNKFPKPKVLELDLVSGEVPLKDFCQRRNPTQDTKRYLVIGMWFKEYRRQDTITPDHIYTCYRLMGWNVPKDVSQPLRDMQKKGWFKNAGRNLWEITHIGINVVNGLGGD